MTDFSKYQGDGSSGIYLGDFCVFSGEVKPLLARAHGESLVVPKTDYEFDDAEMVELLEASTNTITIDFQIENWPAYTGNWAFFTLYEDASSFLSIELTKTNPVE